MKPRRPGLLVAVPAAFVLAACSPATGGTGHAAVARTSVGSGPAPASLSALVSRMRAALVRVTSAHLTMDISAAGQTVTGAGDEQLDHGRLDALDLTMTLAQVGDMQMIVVGGKSYLKMPTPVDDSGRPYVLVTQNSGNPVVKSLAGSLDSALAQASLGGYATMLSAARSFTVVGPTTVVQTAATEYAIVIDTSRLPADTPGRDAITASGIKDLPVDLYLDAEDRTVQLTEQLSDAGQAISTRVDVSDYDQPVTITAPPPDQVSTG